MGRAPRAGDAQESFDQAYARPATASFWRVVVSDPGPENLFAAAVYDRGAMTLHAVRVAIGDPDFFRLLREWAGRSETVPVTTADLLAHAERVSGEQLDALFEQWLVTPVKPPAPAPL